jgi:UDP-N-acetylglucosamine 2-epimerase
MRDREIKLLSIVGARPQFIKLAPIQKMAFSMGITHLTIHTGQHYSDDLSKNLFEDLELKSADYNLQVGSASHGIQTARMLEGIEEVLNKELPTGVLLYGDTNSTLAGALAASKLCVPIFHFESGLRSKNMNMPEEINRIVTDHLSSLLFAPTLNAMDHLKNEGLADRARLTGDIMIDSLQIALEKEAVGKQLEYELGFENRVIVTIHRPENTDSGNKLRNVFARLNESSLSFTVLAHPRLRKMMAEFEITSFGSNIGFADPLPYSSMVRVLKSCIGLVTDSGGLQKEAFLLGTRCLTVRTETEWPETLSNAMNLLDPNLESNLDEYFKDRSEIPISRAFGTPGVASRALLYVSNYLNA